MRTSNLSLRAGRVGVAMLIFWSWFQVSVQAAPRPRFHVTGLPTLPGGHLVGPTAINNHGHVVGRASNSNGASRPFLYRDGVMQELAIGDGPQSIGEARDINDAGQIVAQATVGGFFRGYLITPESTLDLDAQTGLNIWPVAINQAGVIAANIPRGFSTEAITWSNGVVRRLGFLNPTNGSYALDINKRGDVLGTVFVDSTPSLFTALFHDGSLSVLGTFYGQAINDSGEIAGSSYESGVRRAIVYREGSTFDLGTLPGDFKSSPTGINNFGQIVGVSEGAEERYLPFLYDGQMMYDLNDLVKRRLGWSFLVADAINERGQIVGVGYLHGQERAFLLTPVRGPH